MSDTPKYKKVNVDPDEYKEPIPSVPGAHAKSETKEWPPQIGIWKNPQRARSLKKLRLDPKKELVPGFVPNPGVSINGVGIMGKQVLPQSMWASIRAMQSKQAHHEDVFRRGGKEKSEILGHYRG